MAAYSELQEAEFASEANGLHGDQAPARGRHRLFRRRCSLAITGGQVVDHRHEGIDRDGTVPSRGAE